MLREPEVNRTYIVADIWGSRPRKRIGYRPGREKHPRASAADEQPQDVIQTWIPYHHDELESLHISDIVSARVSIQLDSAVRNRPILFPLQN